MRIETLRRVCQHASFVVLHFGGYAGLQLGRSLPCLSCPYVTACAGQCYIYRLQSDLALPFAALFTGAGFEALAAFLLFVGLIILLGKSWCGWICPFGLIQDWVTGIRRFFGIREAAFGKALSAFLQYMKYVMLAWLVLPALLSTDVDLYHSFCRICPVRTLVPPFFNGFTFSGLWALDYTNALTLGISATLMFASGGVVVGVFFKKRFFCYFCPMAAMMHLLKPVTLLRLVKEPTACHGCGTCRRTCSMGLDAAYKERVKKEIQADGCSGCFSCAETCSSSGSLAVKFGPWTIFSASRSHAAKASGGGPLAKIRHYVRKRFFGAGDGNTTIKTSS